MTDDQVHLADLTAAVKTLRQDNARLAEEVRLIRSRSGWILLLAALLFVFGSCSSHDTTDSETRSELGSLTRQVVGDQGDTTSPGDDLRSQQLQQCRMIGRLGRQLKTDPTEGLTSDGGVDSGCVAAAREGFTGRPAQP